MGHGSQGNSVFSDWIDPRDDEPELVDCKACCGSGVEYIYPQGLDTDPMDVEERDCKVCNGDGKIYE